jgi:lambda repressor-like predicted transcriptional regulator
MTAEPDAIRYRRIRAPREDGQALIDPPLGMALQQLCTWHAADVAAPLQRLEACGKSLAELSRLARAELLQLATAYTSQYRDVDRSSLASAEERPIVLAGHQPTLFHPGVWFKNFALSRLAEQGGATAVNLVVDNDTLRAPTIRVPTGSVDSPLFENVPFDEAAAEVAFEERPLLDRATFDSFAARVAEAFQPIVRSSSLPRYTPLLERLWPLAQAARARSSEQTSLGWILAEARHRLEGELGLTTLELPLSAFCDGQAFRWFLVALLADLPRLVSDYNALLAEYRIVNHVRSRSHPVPDLSRQDDWLEAPFWIWSTANPRRRHLFARRAPGGIEITDRAGLVALLPLRADGDATPAVEALGALRARGIKIRSRALLTTMFSRLLASDLFLHGIGGAKYDELTDAIIRRYFGLEPPTFLTVTATFQLPVARPALSIDDLHRHQQRVREIGYHPEQFADHVANERQPEFERLANEKRELLRQLPALRASGRSLKAWHDQLAATNHAMAALLEPYRAELVNEQPQLLQQQHAAQRLSSREYSFALFPEETLPERLEQLTENA